MTETDDDDDHDHDGMASPQSIAMTTTHRVLWKYLSSICSAQDKETSIAACAGALHAAICVMLQVMDEDVDAVRDHVAAIISEHHEQHVRENNNGNIGHG